MNFNTGESWESGSSVHSGYPLLRSPCVQTLCSPNTCTSEWHFSLLVYCEPSFSGVFVPLITVWTENISTLFSIGHWNGLLIQPFLLKLAGDCQGVTLKTSHMSPRDWEFKKWCLCAPQFTRDCQRTCGAVLCSSMWLVSGVSAFIHWNI